MRLTFVTLFLSAALLAGCLGPAVEGPQITQAPEGFAFDPNCTSARSMLPGRRPIDQRCYWNIFYDSPDSFVISEFNGVLEVDDAVAAHEEYVTKWVRCPKPDKWCQEASALSPVEIDGHRGWAYSIVTRSEGKISGADYHVILPWEESTYTLEFSGENPPFLDPQRGRDVAQSFVVRHSSDLLPLQVGAALLFIALCAAGFWWLRRQRAADPVPERAPVKVRVEPTPAARAAGLVPDGRPVLNDAPLRVAALRKAFAGDPEGTLATLRQLESDFAPHPEVLHLLLLGLIQLQRQEEAQQLARRAWPVLVGRGRRDLAQEVFVHLGQGGFEIGLDRRELLQVAEGLVETRFWQHAAHVYGRLLQSAPADKPPAVGLLRIASNHASAAATAEEALRLYQFVAQTSSDPEMQRRAREEMARHGVAQPASN